MRSPTRSLVLLLWAVAACAAPRENADPSDGGADRAGTGGARADMAGELGAVGTGGASGVDVAGPAPGTGGTTPAPATGGATPATGGTGGAPGPIDAPIDLPPTPPAAVCQANQVTCSSPSELSTCAADGSKLTVTPGPAGTPRCAGGRCVTCFSDEHCPQAPTCRAAKCDVAAGTCGTVTTPGRTCETTGACSGDGFCRKPVVVGAFSIDATEVTKAQYSAFLDAKGGDTSGQAFYCGFNTSFTPKQEWPPTTEQLGLPVNWVDWCDAYAYCKWAGKRLCGRIGGGSTPHNDYDKAGVSQWHAACTGNGSKRFPYGSSYDPKKCVGDKSATGGYSGRAQPVASFPGCEGGFAGIFDLSGNLVEWEDSCVAYQGGSDLCRERGNSFQGPDDLDGQPGYFAACDMNNNNPRDSSNNTRGFRCCRDN